MRHPSGQWAGVVKQFDLVRRWPLHLLHREQGKGVRLWYSHAGDAGQVYECRNCGMKTPDQQIKIICWSGFFKVRANPEKKCVLMMAVFRRNTLCIARNSDEIRAQFFRETPK